ncbi:PRK06851 family protein [Bacillus sp. DX1.1]|uniref:PRK06851 family protein n=1 Tax=unclassified Bacillus (in: firmicutes) TaxID=185979 RepID=UPI0025711CF3|nr:MULTISPECIES: PRK06851 family protein [unclassified Bacillus (in: firmicutes)]MDM5153194.1 PRK06851 family protein [Bacillus sp. DX1.1]WJE82157.1 PRK06851 family protein [Bacillus sp. DX3.1]
MTGRILNYYAGGNTARGFYSLYEENLIGLERLFILKGGPGTGKSSLMKAIGREWAERGYDIELLHCSSDNNSIDGVIIPKLKVGIVDGTAPHVIEPKVPGVVEEYVNLGVAWDSEHLRKYKNEITRYVSEASGAFQSAYACFQEALAVHDDWEKIYIDNINFQKANELTEELIQKLFTDKQGKHAIVKHRFLGAATPKGAVDFVPNLTEGLPNRYFIKGRPGSGKSTMLKKIAVAAEEKGFDVEVYHCGFDPNSLDMIIVRELGFAIFDSTAPHEYFPVREGDEIIDMYDLIVTPGTDEKYATEIRDVSIQYKTKMNEAMSFLAKAKAVRDKLERIYIAAMDFTKVDAYKKEIQSEFERIAKLVAQGQK